MPMQYHGPRVTPNFFDVRGGWVPCSEQSGNSVSNRSHENRFTILENCAPFLRLLGEVGHIKAFPGENYGCCDTVTRWGSGGILFQIMGDNPK